MQTPHLDRKHVVFGRVEKGADIIEKMQRNPCDRNDKPLRSVQITKCGGMRLKKPDSDAPKQAVAPVARLDEKQQPKEAQEGVPKLGSS